MGIGAPNPGIWGEPVRKALTAGQGRDAQEHDADAERALLDAEELRELERSELYGATPQVRQRSRLRSLLDRLIHR